MGFPGGTSVKEPAFQCRRHKRHGFDPGSGRSKGMITYSRIIGIPGESLWTEESLEA